MPTLQSNCRIKWVHICKALITCPSQWTSLCLIDKNKSINVLEIHELWWTSTLEGKYKAIYWAWILSLKTLPSEGDPHWLCRDTLPSKEPPLSQLWLGRGLQGWNHRTQSLKEPQTSLPTGNTRDPLLYNLCIPSSLILITLYETGIFVIPNLEMRKLTYSESGILLRITKLQKSSVGILSQVV